MDGFFSLDWWGRNKHPVSRILSLSKLKCLERNKNREKEELCNQRRRQWRLTKRSLDVSAHPVRARLKWPFPSHLVLCYYFPPKKIVVVLSPPSSGAHFPASCGTFLSSIFLPTPPFSYIPIPYKTLGPLTMGNILFLCGRNRGDDG